MSRCKDCDKELTHLGNADFVCWNCMKPVGGGRYEHVPGWRDRPIESTRTFRGHNVKLKIKKLDKDLPTPAYQTKGAAALDLYSREEGWIMPGERHRFPTGIAVQLPPDTAGFVCPRSGWADKRGITLLNSPGVVDDDYRGEVGALMINMDSAPHHVKRGDRVAQLVVVPILRVDLDVVDELDETERGTGGFGSTNGF
jgi:dUTP pyrophosphatase